MASRYLLLRRLGKTPGSTTYHLLYKDSYDGSFNAVETLTGQNAKPLCDRGRPSPANILVFEGPKMELTGMKLCRHCRHVFKDWLEICSVLRENGLDPNENVWNRDGAMMSLTGLTIDYRRKIPPQRAETSSY